jgi:phage-related protein
MNSVIGALRVVLGADIAEFEKGMAAASKKLEAVGNKMKTIGTVATAAVSAPLLLLGKNFISAASDAEEFGSAFDYLFKNNADSMRAWSDTLGQEIGRSTNELQRMASSFMQLFKQVNSDSDAGQKAAADLSKEFTQLAQDLASFYNIAESDALDKLRSGLAGEAEPMRAFGVFMNAAAVEAKALEMGLVEANGEITEQSKVLARAQVILASTKDAQGDAARTSDSYANSVRRLQGAWQELSVEIGKVLLPMATTVVKALSPVLEWFKNLDPEMKKIIVVFAAVATALGPIIIAAGFLATALAALSPIVVVVIAGIGLLVAAAILLGPAFMDMGKKIAETFGKIPEAWEETKKRFTDFVKAIIAKLGEWAQAGKDKIIEWKNYWKELKDSIVGFAKQIYEGVEKWIGDKLNELWDSAKAKIEEVKTWFYKLYDEIVGHSIIPDMVVEVGDWMNRLGDEMPKAAQGAAAGVTDAFSSMAGDAFGGMKNALGGLEIATAPASASVPANDIGDGVTSVSISMPVQMVDPGSPTSRRQAARDLANEVVWAMGR